MSTFLFGNHILRLRERKEPATVCKVLDFCHGPPTIDVLQQLKLFVRAVTAAVTHRFTATKCWKGTSVELVATHRVDSCCPPEAFKGVGLS